jgi:hypothetical protein
MVLSAPMPEQTAPGCGEGVPVRSEEIHRLLDGEVTAEAGRPREWRNYVFDIMLCKKGRIVAIPAAWHKADGSLNEPTHFLEAGGAFGTSGSSYSVQTNFSQNVIYENRAMRSAIYIDMYWGTVGRDKDLPDSPRLEARYLCNNVDADGYLGSCMGPETPVPITMRGKPYKVDGVNIVPIALEWPGKDFPLRCVKNMVPHCKTP